MTFNELNININEILEPEVSTETNQNIFPCPEKYYFIFDFHSFIKDSSYMPPIRDFINECLRKFEVIFGKENCRFLNLVYNKRSKEIKTIPNNIICSDKNFLSSLKNGGHFFLEFNIDTRNPLLFVYFISFIILLADTYYCSLELRLNELNHFAHKPTLWIIKQQYDIILDGKREILDIKNNPNANILDLFGLYSIFISLNEKNVKRPIGIAYDRLSKLHQIIRNNHKRKILTEDGEAYI
jgi:hypothetical protein